MSASSAAKPFDCIVFDLDDTLLDTYRQLVPRASRDACSAMIEAGMSSSLQDCLQAWDGHGRQHARKEILSYLVTHFGVTGGIDPKSVVARGHHAFYNRRVESDISLFEGARELLADLHGRYELHLVTSGTRSTQEEKIRILNLDSYFATISHVDPTQGQTKHEAFSRVAKKTSAPPARHLSVGNRVDTDIGEARALGWKGCWVRYGEHAAMLPSTPIEQPDFIIDRITELSAACRL